MTEQIRVASYNIRTSLVDDDPQTWEERVDDVARVIRLYRPTIIGLQEPTANQFVDLRDRLPDYKWVGIGRRGGDEGEFSPIGFRKSQFELIESDTFWLSETPDEVGSVGWDADLPRILTWARLRYRETGTTLVHANTHFDHRGETARLESARLLTRRLDAIVDNSVVLTGDFNCEPDDTPYEALVESGEGIALEDAKDEPTNGHLGPHHTYTGFTDLKNGRRIDYVFVSPNVIVDQHSICTNLRTDGTIPSDHIPVVVDFSV
jgi:endonuclease/exonuclease/phosphatase family metal-dependent hydrolase